MYLKYVFYQLWKKFKLSQIGFDFFLVFGGLGYFEDYSFSDITTYNFCLGLNFLLAPIFIPVLIDFDEIKKTNNDTDETHLGSYIS